MAVGIERRVFYRQLADERDRFAVAFYFPIDSVHERPDPAASDRGAAHK